MYFTFKKQGKGGVPSATELRHQDESEGSETSKTPSQEKSAPDRNHVCHAGVCICQGNKVTAMSVDELLPPKGLCGRLALAVQVGGLINRNSGQRGGGDVVFYVQLSADIWRFVTKNGGYSRTKSGYIHPSLYIKAFFESHGTHFIENSNSPS